MVIKEAASVAKEPATVRAKVAADIAEEVRSSLGASKLTKVTSLMHAFRVQGSPTRFSEVRRALASEGLRMSSGWTVDSKEDIRRTGVVELSDERRHAERSCAPALDATIRLTVWSPRVVARECALPAYDGTSSPEDVLWFDIDAPETLREPVEPAATRSTVRPAFLAGRRRQPRRPAVIDELTASDRPPAGDNFEEHVLYVAEQLSRWCPGLEEEMVRDLLRQDVQPKVETYGDESDGVRGVSVVAVIGRELPGRPGDSDGVSEQLLFQVVEMIVGPGWIVTCWHPSRVYTGTDEHRQGQPVLREPFLSHVRHRWFNDDVELERPHKTSGDLGIYLARALVDTYGASHRMMERWVEGWEVDFYRCLSGREG